MPVRQLFSAESSLPIVPQGKNVPTGVSTIAQLTQLSEDEAKRQLPIQIETEVVAFDKTARSLYVLANGTLKAIWLQDGNSSFQPGTRILIEGKTVMTNGQPGIIDAQTTLKTEGPPQFANIFPGQSMTNETLWAETEGVVARVSENGLHHLTFELNGNGGLVRAEVLQATSPNPTSTFQRASPNSRNLRGCF